MYQFILNDKPISMPWTYMFYMTPGGIKYCASTAIKRRPDLILGIVVLGPSDSLSNLTNQSPLFGARICQSCRWAQTLSSFILLLGLLVLDSFGESYFDSDATFPEFAMGTSHIAPNAKCVLPWDGRCLLQLIHEPSRTREKRP